LIEAKREKEQKSVIKIFDQDPEIKILDGRWGPYITYKGKNYKIPKNVKAVELTADDCKEIISGSIQTKAKKTNKKKKQ